MPDEKLPRWPRKMCAVCRHRLNAKEDPVTNELMAYEHGEGYYDHQARPVNEVLDDTILVCDFCLTSHPTWDFPANEMPGILKSGDILISTGDWAACDECKELIVADDYEGLVARAARGHMKADPDVQAMMESSPALRLFGQMNLRNQMLEFKKARSGPPIALTQATWIASRLREVLGEEEE